MEKMQMSKSEFIYSVRINKDEIYFNIATVIGKYKAIISEEKMECYIQCEEDIGT